MVPRIKGKVSKAENNNDPKIDGKYFFHVFVCELSGEQVGEPIGPFGPYETEAKAKNELREACKMACETIELKLTGEKSGKYIDLKNEGIQRSWDEH